MYELKLTDSFFMLRLVKLKLGLDCGTASNISRVFSSYNAIGVRPHQQHPGKVVKSEKIRAYPRCYYQQQHNRYFKIVRDTGGYGGGQQDQQGLPTQEGVAKNADAVTTPPADAVTTSPADTAQTPGISRKTANNYTINIYYNDPKKQQQQAVATASGQPPVDDYIERRDDDEETTEAVLAEAEDVETEKQYDDALRHVLLLHLLKDRTLLEKSFMKFLDEDLKDMNPQRVQLLRDYLLAKSTSATDNQPYLPSNETAETLRATAEQNKMAFVKEALDLCDKIINEPTTNASDENENDKYWPSGRSGRRGGGTGIVTGSNMFKYTPYKADYEDEVTYSEDAMIPRGGKDGKGKEEEIQVVEAPQLMKGLSDEQLAAIHKATNEQYVKREGGVARTRRDKKFYRGVNRVSEEDEEEEKKGEGDPDDRGSRFRRIVCGRRGCPFKNLEVETDELEFDSEKNAVYKVKQKSEKEETQEDKTEYVMHLSEDEDKKVRPK